MKKLPQIFVISMLVLCSGCASILSKSEYPVNITTNASDAKIKIRNAASGVVIFSGNAPLLVTLKAGSGFTGANYQCEVTSKDGKRQYRAIVASVDPWFFGNFFLGGLIGMAIDGSTGAMYKLDDGIYVHFSEYDTPEYENLAEKQATEKSENKNTVKENSSAPVPEISDTVNAENVETEPKKQCVEE